MKPFIDVKGLRKKHGLLQREAAEKLGVTRAYLSTVETGKRGISMNMMEALIRVFGVKYEDFYAESNTTKSVITNTNVGSSD